ncbi:MAG TPA: DinB family protein [Terriglobales bacterium]|jgi:hypothetical protein
MKRVLIVVLFAITGVAGAQDKNPVTSTLKEILPRQQKNLIAAVEEMPAEKFSYKPTPPQMTFGKLVAHMIEANVELCAKVGDMSPPPMHQPQETDGKDKLVDGLKKSFEFCNAAIGRASDSKLGDTVDLYGGRQGPRVVAYFALTNDWADHYSAAAMYLRLNGLLPPTAKK